MTFWKSFLKWMNEADVFYESYTIRVSRKEKEILERKFIEDSKKGIITISNWKEIGGGNKQLERNRWW